METAQASGGANATPSPVLAAGGIVWGPKPGGRRIAVVHRKRHGGDWTLPKGKWQEGESLTRTATREVQEEIGTAALLGAFAGTVDYLLDGGVPKVVLFWHMKLASDARFVPSEEVDQLVWLRPGAAITRLSYERERELVSRASGFAHPVGGARRNGPKGIRRRRLGAELAAYSSELGRRIDAAVGEAGSWALAAEALMRRSADALLRGNLQEGWECLLAAQRMEIFDMKGAELSARAKTLREEAGKLTTWRQSAVRATLDLLPQDLKDQEESKDGPQSLVYRATRLRDEHFANLYFRHELSWQQLKILSILLLVVTASAVALLTMTGALTPAGHVPHSILLAAAALFGAMGAGFSTALSLLQMPFQARIPERMAQSSITFTRPLLGAVAGLVTYAFLESGLFQLPDLNLFIALLAAFAAGFSDRLVLRAVEAVGGAGAR